MSYTLLRVAEAGVVLRAGHRARFAGCGAEVVGAFDDLSRLAKPGIYSLLSSAPTLVVRERPASTVHEGLAIRFLPSPIAGAGALAKPAPPCAYDAVRGDAFCTFLTDASGGWVIEACRGIALAFIDGAFVRADSRHARVASVVEEWLAENGMGAVRLPTTFEGPWAVANAVAGVVCIGNAGRHTDEARAAAAVLNRALASTASRG